LGFAKELSLLSAMAEPGSTSRSTTPVAPSAHFTMPEKAKAPETGAAPWLFASYLTDCRP
jgi:hypothetical protein